ncbi:MAG TPA: SDR family oxidoreductase [Candidatus Paceibacterota bacterium]
MKPRLENKVALITGGAAGIGLAIAKRFASEGAKVVVADVNEAVGVTAATSFGGTFMKLDVSSEDAWKGIMAAIETQFGRLDILVNNAGIMGKGAQDPENATLADWKLIHSINLDSVFLGCKYAMPLMKKTAAPDNTASIVNMSSRSGIVGVPGAAAYASTKAAVRNHTKTVALYCAKQGYNIRCNSLHPASILTDMWKAMLGEGEAYAKNMAKFAADVPMKRFGTPEEVANAALFLASNESSYCTGSELTVDGGIMAGTTTSPDTGLEKK